MAFVGVVPCANPLEYMGNQQGFAPTIQYVGNEIIVVKLKNV
jgi:hypothetical protein